MLLTEGDRVIGETLLRQVLLDEGLVNGLLFGNGISPLGLASGEIAQHHLPSHFAYL